MDSSNPVQKLAGFLVGLLGLGLCAAGLILHEDLPLPRAPFLIGFILIAWGVQLATGWKLFRELSAKDHAVSTCFMGGGVILVLSGVPLFLSLTRPEFRVVSGLTFLGTALVGAGIIALGWRLKRGRLEKTRGISRN